MMRRFAPPFASVLLAARSEVAMHELDRHRALAYR